MEYSVKQRIKDLLSINRISITTLSKAIGVPQPTLNRQINTDAPMTLNNILLILDYFTSISSEWLLRGKGDMLIYPDIDQPLEKKSSPIKYYAEVEITDDSITIKRKSL